jgi:hypothetical protein
VTPLPDPAEGEALEPQCVKLVAALNLLSGVSTTASCGCCSRGERYYVAFVIERPGDLLPLVSLLRRPSLQGWIVEATALGMGPHSFGLVNPPYELRFYLSYDGQDGKAAHRASEKLATQVRHAARALNAPALPPSFAQG